MSGKLYLVSVGPGFAEMILPKAKEAIKNAEIIVTYDLYLNWIRDWVEGKEIITMPLTQEKARATKAIELARQGKNVCLLSSGDIGVYGMAPLVYEQLTPEDETLFKTELIPGVTSALSCGSLLGAPFGHDFATLSLSDLMCPWEWIKHRAKCLAESDLPVAFYNVQSKKRQTGVYEILSTFADYRDGETWCAIIRNAYRDDQSIKILSLDELRKQTFDMFTTIIVGNKFTQKQNNFLYAPRGYHGWDQPKEETPELKEGSLWVFSGTSDGNELAQLLDNEIDFPVVISTSSKYGSIASSHTAPSIPSTSGRIGKEKRTQLLQNKKCKAIVDATHPYAINITTQLLEISKELNLPYIRYERPTLKVPDGTILCSTPKEAAEKAVDIGKNIFLTTGSNALKEMTSVKKHTDTQWFVRQTPDTDNIELALKAGISYANICAMQGPFTEEMNEALCKTWNIDCIVTKESGHAGGFQEKCNIAEKLNIPLIVIKRPSITAENTFSDFNKIKNHLKEIL